MATSWPEHTSIETNFKNAFQLAEVFELHCAKIYAHAANHPDHHASADYVRELVSQAYRAVHSLNMQNTASSLLDLQVATATLDDKAKEYCPVSTSKTLPLPTGGEINGNENTVTPGLKDLLTGEYEDEDEEEDSDWEESEEDTDDEYYEYCSGSDAELDDDELEAVARTTSFQQTIQEEKKSNANPTLNTNSTSKPTPNPNPNPSTSLSTTEETSPNQDKIDSKKEESIDVTKDETPSPQPVSIIQDQAMHDRITAALRTLPLPCHESELEEIPLQRVMTHVPRPPTQSTVSPTTEDTQSEATAVQTRSNQEGTCAVVETSVTAPAAPVVSVTGDDLGRGRQKKKDSFDAERLQRKLSMRSSPADFPRRFKTVCYKYVRRAMVPLRGQAN